MSEEPKTLTMTYCPICSQAIKFVKKHNKWKHIGYKRWNEPYSDFLKRDEHLTDEIARSAKPVVISANPVCCIEGYDGVHAGVPI